MAHLNVLLIFTKYQYDIPFTKSVLLIKESNVNRILHKIPSIALLFYFLQRDLDETMFFT